MNILAIDLGTKTGYAMLVNGLVLSGRLDFSPSRFDGGGARYLKFQRWLNEVRTNAGEINCVYYEAVRRHLSTDAAHVYGGFLATLTSWAETANIPYEGRAVQSIKKFATGKGNASKAEVQVAMQMRYGFATQSDDEADALAILALAASEEGVELPRRKG
jgi:Holliday junction resolvasome RuvABC endonuclease subunit